MSFDSLLIHTVTVRRFVKPDAADRYGNRELAHDARLDVTTPARIDFTIGDEQLDNRDLQRERGDVLLPPEIVVEGYDRLYWHDEDVELKIDGPVRPVYDGIGKHHLELTVYRVEG